MRAAVRSEARIQAKNESLGLPGLFRLSLDMPRPPCDMLGALNRESPRQVTSGRWALAWTPGPSVCAGRKGLRVGPRRDRPSRGILGARSAGGSGRNRRWAQMRPYKARRATIRQTRPECRSTSRQPKPACAACVCRRDCGQVEPAGADSGTPEGRGGLIDSLLQAGPGPVVQMGDQQAEQTAERYADAGGDRGDDQDHVVSFHEILLFYSFSEGQTHEQEDSSHGATQGTEKEGPRAETPRRRGKKRRTGRSVWLPAAPDKAFNFGTLFKPARRNRKSPMVNAKCEGKGTAPSAERRGAAPG